MSKLGLDRQILAGITTNHQAIVALERVFTDVGETFPRGIEEATQQAIQAISLANAALVALVEISAGLDLLAAGPVPDPVVDADDLTPPAPVLVELDDLGQRPHLGTISAQDHDAVDITGGTVGLSAGTVALPSFYIVDRATGLYRAAVDEWRLTVNGTDLLIIKTAGLSTNKPITSTLATGAAPFVVASTTKVINLNADQLDDGDWATPGAIGTAVKNTGSFTTLSGDNVAATNLTTGAAGFNGKTPQGPKVSGGTLAGVISALVANGILTS